MSIRLAISVEGPTEETFVKTVLCPYLMEKSSNLSTITPILIEHRPKRDKHNQSRKYKGGFVNLKNIKESLNRIIDDFDKITTLYDFYGFDNKGTKNKQQLEKDILNTISPNQQKKLIPYVQMYEFEGLLFSDPTVLGDCFYEQHYTVWANNILTKFNNNPETINDSKEDALSKRLEKKIENYDKVVHGSFIAMNIGIDTIKQKCPNFKEWVEKLENLI